MFNYLLIKQTHTFNLPEFSALAFSGLPKSFYSSSPTKTHPEPLFSMKQDREAHEFSAKVKLDKVKQESLPFDMSQDSSFLRQTMPSVAGSLLRIRMLEV